MMSSNGEPGGFSYAIWGAALSPPFCKEEIGMSHQVALTIITEIKAGEVEDIKQLLKTMSDNVACNGVIPFGKFSNIHFARLFVLDESIDLNGAVIAPSLVLMSECDAPLGRFLNELVDMA